MTGLRAHVLVSPGLPSTVCCCRAVLSRQHVADARAAGRGLVRRRASTACSRFRLRVEYVMVSTLYATGPSGRFPDSSRRYGGSCIAINPSHRDRRRVRTLRCSLLRVKRCYLLTVDREPSRAALSAHGSSPRASIRATMTSRHVTSEIAPCRGAARPAAAHPRAVRCRARARLPPLGWCRSVDERSQFTYTKSKNAVTGRRQIRHG